MSKLLSELGLKVAPDRKDKAFIRGASKSDIAYAKDQFGSKGKRLNELTGGFPLTNEQGELLDKALEENLKDRSHKWLKDRNNYEPLAKGLIDNIVNREKSRLDPLAAAVADDPRMTKVPVGANAEDIKSAGLVAARQAVTNALKTRDTRTEQDINNAKGLLPAVGLAITKAEDMAREKNRVDLLAKAVSDDPRMTKVPVDANADEILAAGLVAARQAVTNALKTRDTRTEADVNKAKGLLPAVGLAITKAETTAKARLAYESEYAKIQADYNKAVQVWTMGLDKLNLNILVVPINEFWGPYNEWNNAVKAKEWVKAKAAVPPLGKVVVALNKAAASALADKPDFDKEEKKIVNLQAAKNISNKPPLALVNAEVKVFREKYETFNTAKNNGEFGVAKNAVAPLQLAITNLIGANQKIEEQKKKFNEEKAKIADYDTAKALAAAKSPAVTATIAAFTLADGNVDAQVKKQDWTEATKLVGALKDATGKLIEARNTSNSKLTAEDKKKFAEKMKALEPRTKVADADGPTKFVNDQKTVVKDAVAKISSAVSASDYATAELLRTQLLPLLDKMDQAIKDYNEHFKKFTEAKNGEVKKARETPLEPQKLRETRDKALKAMEDRIDKTAAKGSIKKADGLIPTWIEEAKAWAGAKAAFDNLNTGANPDHAVLKGLADKPGGGEVLDALIDGLPEGRPEKFIKEAMSLRYGINVKHFENKTAKYYEDETGMRVVGPNVPDKDLKKMYQMFGKVPIGNIKGKVTELIQFDEDAGGAAALGGKIWMYAGRPDKGNKQQFEGALPPGEEVEEAFQPANNDPIPYFDFAALHEVGHIVDEKEGVTDSTKGKKDAIAGWQTHPSTDDVAKIAAAHFKYNEKFVIDTLRDPKSNPPTVIPTRPTGTKQEDWDKAREKVVEWCKLIREDRALWYNASIAKYTAIGGRVYQEAYVGQPFVSYDLAARNKGISPYQFRSKKEWFAELYAAYFSGKLKKNHPYASWLKPLKTIK